MLEIILRDIAQAVCITTVHRVSNIAGRYTAVQVNRVAASAAMMVYFDCMHNSLSNSVSCFFLPLMEIQIGEKFPMNFP